MRSKPSLPLSATTKRMANKASPKSPNVANVPKSPIAGSNGKDEGGGENKGKGGNSKRINSRSSKHQGAPTFQDTLSKKGQPPSIQTDDGLDPSNYGGTGPLSIRSSISEVSFRQAQTPKHCNKTAISRKGDVNKNARESEGGDGEQKSGGSDDDKGSGYGPSASSHQQHHEDRYSNQQGQGGAARQYLPQQQRVGLQPPPPPPQPLRTHHRSGSGGYGSKAPQGPPSFHPSTLGRCQGGAVTGSQFSQQHSGGPPQQLHDLGGGDTSSGYYQRYSQGPATSHQGGHGGVYGHSEGSQQEQQGAPAPSSGPSSQPHYGHGGPPPPHRSGTGVLKTPPRNGSHEGGGGAFTPTRRGWKPGGARPQI